MELCKQSLNEVKREAKILLKQGSSGINEKEIRRMIRDTLLGLSELHQKDIVHLDLKPSNILLGQSSKHKLADLGMARFIVKITDAENIPEGDSRYLSKEVLSTMPTGHVPDLKKADIFSLGITAYELMTLQDLPKYGNEW